MNFYHTNKMKITNQIIIILILSEFSHLLKISQGIKAAETETLPKEKAITSVTISNNLKSYLRIRNNKTNKGFMIVGGNEAEPNRYKYFCDILTVTNSHISSPSTSLQHVCGCTLISSNVVLTAAHCTVKKNDIVYVGNTYLTKEENEKNNVPIEIFKVMNKKTHPLWNREKFDYDVMILELDGHSTMKPVTLRLTKEWKRRGTTYTVLGFGARSYYDSKMDDYSTVLREVQVDFMKSGECEEYYKDYISDSVVCAYAPGKDACIGDSVRLC